MKRAITLSRLGLAARAIVRKRSLLVPVSAAFALTLVQPGFALASSPEVIVEKALAFDTATQNSFTQAALVSPSFMSDNAKRDGATYRISYAGTALMLPGASKTVKYVAPAPKPAPTPVEPVPATVQLAAAPAPVRKPEPARQPAPTPAPAPARTEPAAPEGRQPIGEQTAIRWGGWAKAGTQFPYGYCTYFAAQYRGGVDFLGNGGQWYANAAAAGYKVGSKPVKDAIFVTTESGVGHVGIVISVNADGSFVTKEMNYAGYGVISSRTLPANFGALIGFIY